MFMRSIIKISLFVAIFACLFSLGFAQTPAVNKGKPVNWTAISGKDNEFALYMPEGYIVTGDNDYYLGGPLSAGARIDKQIILARYINGVVLLMNYYEGGGKQAQKILLEREKLSPGKEEEVNGFQVRNFSGKVENRFEKTQHFLIKNRLYIVKTISATENDPIARAFFESIRLTNQNNTVAPNAATGATTTNLPPLSERETDKTDDSKIFSITEVDRKPIVLKSRRPSYTPEMRRASMSGKVKLKLLFSSSGAITNIEVVESPSREMTEVSIQAARGTVFIPAEKDGKLVSVYKFIEHRFDVR